MKHAKHGQTAPASAPTPSQKSKRILRLLIIIFLATIGLSIIFAIIFGILLVSALTKYSAL